MSHLAKRVCGIYAIEHVSSGRVYIGSSIDIATRWHGHVRSLDSDKHHAMLLQRAWNKHGSDAFVFKVLWTCERSALSVTEQSYIGAVPKRLLLNGSPFSIGPAQCPYVAAKISRAKIGHPVYRTKQWKQAVSRGMKEAWATGDREAWIIKIHAQHSTLAFRQNMANKAKERQASLSLEERRLITAAARAAPRNQKRVADGRLRLLAAVRASWGDANTKAARLGVLGRDEKGRWVGRNAPC